jgi:Cu(I)-responsive transcriptional regulator
MRIGELARRTGVRVETIRWYEKAGLLKKPDRSAANYRDYDQQALARLSFVKRGRDLGFSLEQIGQLMDLTRHPTSDCATVNAIASEHLSQIEHKIADLAALRHELTGLVETCSGSGAIGDCDILRALAPLGSPY